MPSQEQIRTGEINAARAETKGAILTDETYDKQAAFLEKNGFTNVGEQELEALDDSEAKAVEQNVRMQEIQKRLAAEAKVANSDMTQDEVDELFERAGIK